MSPDQVSACFAAPTPQSLNDMVIPMVDLFHPRITVHIALRYLTSLMQTQLTQAMSQPWTTLPSTWLGLLLIQMIKMGHSKVQ